MNLYVHIFTHTHSYIKISDLKVCDPRISFSKCTARVPTLSSFSLLTQANITNHPTLSHRPKTQTYISFPPSTLGSLLINLIQDSRTQLRSTKSHSKLLKSVPGKQRLAFVLGPFILTGSKILVHFIRSCLVHQAQALWSWLIKTEENNTGSRKVGFYQKKKINTQRQSRLSKHWAGFGPWYSFCLPPLRVTFRKA